ncbi:TasA family protein [Alicyclobacillus tolerans]|uniref:Uncharacterized protein n=1 Tax=Alicyclobacillus tolerans TaxID=90970 RepID=A0ABT9LZ21_9BACL|nr:TasA family protein [Alicyclobacillus tengchongensis]MDP9729512.1 hypothetical protein [Alicyclobacillus tengchongensis]
MKSKIGAVAATSLAGLAMMGAGSYALFTAQAQSNTQSFGAGVVDVQTQGQGFQTFSDDHPIDFYNMVPGDYAGGVVVFHNTGSVNEIVNVLTHAHGPIFWNDGLNNGKVTTLSGFSNGHLPSNDSPVASTAESTYAEFWQPRLLANGPTVVTDNNGNSGWESVDYEDSSHNPLNEFDNYPASYTVKYQIYQSYSGYLFDDSNGGVVIQGTPASNSQIVQPEYPVTYSYRPDGFDTEMNPYSWQTIQAGQSMSGSSKIEGIVLAPGQYLVLDYSGQLPKKAGNDYQDAWGNISVSLEAAQYENNHSDSQQPVLNDGSTVITTGGGSVSSTTNVQLTLTGAKATNANLTSVENYINQLLGSSQAYNITLDNSGTEIDFNFNYSGSLSVTELQNDIQSYVNSLQ